MPTFRGTYGLWTNFPAIKKERILFEDMQEASFFRRFPEKYWYVYGHLFNRLSIAEPHEGYQHLHHILKQCPSNYIYHQGIDNLYSRSMHKRVC